MEGKRNTETERKGNVIKAKPKVLVVYNALAYHHFPFEFARNVSPPHCQTCSFVGRFVQKKLCSTSTRVLLVAHLRKRERGLRKMGERGEMFDQKISTQKIIKKIIDFT